MMVHFLPAFILLDNLKFCCLLHCKCTVSLKLIRVCKFVQQMFFSTRTKSPQMKHLNHPNTSIKKWQAGEVDHQVVDIQEGLHNPGARQCLEDKRGNPEKL